MGMNILKSLDYIDSSVQYMQRKSFTEVDFFDVC